MAKLIYAINTRNKSFNLLEEVYKDFGVVFHPKSTVDSVANFIKEKANGKSTSEASSQVRQGNSERTRLVEKAREDKEQQKIFSLEDTSNEVSSSFSLKREDK
ncbi:hypothetical protein HTVC026P_gp08 [Pelagibacter phage HTVC026P]|nr:hypothetical protein HTVC026P_gp08 [Pelagibacter phage HTVC026P]